MTWFIILNIWKVKLLLDNYDWDKTDKIFKDNKYLNDETIKYKFKNLMTFNENFYSNDLLFLDLMMCLFQINIFSI